MTARKAPPKSRRKSRELALKGLYQWLQNPTDLGVVQAHLEEDEDYRLADGEHFVALLEGTLRRVPELDAALAPYLDRAVDELSPVEHGALLLGAFELLHQPEVPYRVVINEAVELAKAYGGTDGHKFVNGVLDKLAAQAREVEIRAKLGGAPRKGRKPA